MKTTFETYRAKPDEFKIAQPRSANPFKTYVPTPHPFTQRLEEYRAVQSLWTPGNAVGVKQ